MPRPKIEKRLNKWEHICVTEYHADIFSENIFIQKKEITLEVKDRVQSRTDTDYNFKIYIYG